jgi:anti-anti-sigma factor
VQVEKQVLYDEAEMLLFYAEIDRLLEDQVVKELVLDFAQVSSTGSVGLSMLVRLNAKCEMRKRRLALCGIGPTVLEVLKITNLNQMFRIRENAAD